MAEPRRQAISSWRSRAVYLAVALLLSSPALAQNVRPDESKMKSSDALREVFRSIAGPANKSTVAVRARIASDDDNVRQVAFGTVVSADGYVLTKASEVLGRKHLEVIGSRGEVYAATIVGVSERQDVAMLKIDAHGLVPVEWADLKTDKIAVGAWVASAGPVVMEGEEPVAVGVVSVGRRRIPELAGFLGIEMADTADNSGVKIAQVLAGSGAEKAGVAADDVIVALDEKPVRTHFDLKYAVRQYQPGDVVTLSVRRAAGAQGKGGPTLQLSVTLGGNPEEEDSRFSMVNLLGGAVSKRATDFAAVLQHDTVLRPMDCGGPLVDLSGKVIGINIARAGRTETYALPADVVEGLIGGLESGKMAPSGSASTMPAK